VKISPMRGVVVCLAVWLTGVAVGLPRSAWAQGAVGKGQEAEFPETRTVSATNSPSALVAPRFEALRRLEEQLNEALKRFAPKSEGAGPGNSVSPPPQAPAPTSRSNTKAQDALDRKQNWGFMGLEEMMGLPAREDPKEPMSFDDKGKKSKGSLIERYYEGLGKKPSGQDTTTKNGDKSPGPDRSRDEDSLPPRLHDAQNNLRKLFDSDGNGRIFESTPNRTSLSDTFGLGNGGMSPANAEASHRAYLNQYREVLGISAPGTDPGKLIDSSSSLSGKMPLTANSPLTAANGRGGSLGQLGSINPVLTPKGPEDVNTRALNQWNPMYSPPRVETKPLPPSRPAWEAPRRKF